MLSCCTKVCTISNRIRTISTGSTNINTLKPYNINKQFKHFNYIINIKNNTKYNIIYRRQFVSKINDMSKTISYVTDIEGN